MASADQLKALLKSHMEGDDQRFFSVAMQLAAHEAKLGHGQLAEELRALIDEAKRRPGTGQPTPISRPRGELANLLTVSYPKSRLTDMVLDDALAQQIHRVIREQRHAARILEHCLSPRRKLLLVGPPGTGKTLTASVLGGELGIPLFQVRLDGLITKYMGETAAKLRQIFEATGQTRGIYFFDEFDAIGSQRGLTNDVGEIRRVLNSFLQMIEQDQSHSLIVATTNHAEFLDHALFRRFDDVLRYELPAEAQIAALLRARLLRFSAKGVSWKRLAGSAAGLSYAEVAKGLFVASDLVSQRMDKDHSKRYIEAKDVSRWTYKQYRWLEWGTDRSPRLLTRPTFEQLYEVLEKVVAADVSGAENRAAYDDKCVFHSHTLISFVPWHMLAGVRSNSLKKSARYRDERPPRPDLPKREDLEATSRRFSVKYLLRVMNSSAARDFLRANRRSNIHLYPDDWKKLPIPDVSADEQSKIVALVDHILAAKKQNPNADTSAFEREADRLVYGLYGLTEEEIAIVEGKS